MYRLTEAQKAKIMGFYKDSGEYVLEDGKFRIYVGGNSRDCLTREVWLNF